DGVPVHTRDHGLRDIPDDGLQHFDGQPHGSLAVVLTFVDGLVATGAERALAGACEHDDANGLFQPARLNASINSSTVLARKALRRSSRLMVMVATPSCSPYKISV